MHIAHEYFASDLVAHAPGYALCHATGGAIGERETQHVGIIHPVFVRTTDAFGKNLCLAASRRSQNKMVAALCLNHFLLAWVGNKREVHNHSFFYLFSVLCLFSKKRHAPSRSMPPQL